MNNLSPVVIGVLMIGILVFLGLSVGLLILQQSQNRWQAQCVRYHQAGRVSTTTLKTGQGSFFAGLGVLYPVSASERIRLTQMLEQAGVSGQHLSLNVIRGIKLFTGLCTSLLVLIWQWSQSELISISTFAMVLVGYVLGANIPEYWLRRLFNLAKQRQQQVVPDAIDLMVISIEAGLSLDRSLEKVGQYLLDVEPMLAKQFLRTHAEIQVIGESAECLKKLAWRTGLLELERLASTLAMAERYGSPLADTMRTISGDARQLRKMALQERAGKLPGLITLIQMSFIMLPLLVLIIAPTMNLLLESLR